jgi:flagellar biosynthetic protein FliP
VVGPAAAQNLSLDLGEGGSLTNRLVQFLALLTVLSLAPSLLMMVTSFTRIVIVLSLLRTAIGAASSPPNIVMVSLALFMTFFVMQPVFEEAYTDGIQPLVAEKIDEATAYTKTVAPFHKFMMAHTREKDLQMFLDLSKRTAPETPELMPIQILIPAFMISEIRRAFEIGFLLFIPFIVIDLVVASVLVSMGMQTLPPATISLPFKLVFFVLVDGWHLVAGSLIQSYGT